MGTLSNYGGMMRLLIFYIVATVIALIHSACTTEVEPEPPQKPDPDTTCVAPKCYPDPKPGETP